MHSRLPYSSDGVISGAATLSSHDWPSVAALPSFICLMHITVMHVTWLRALTAGGSGGGAAAADHRPQEG